MEFELFQILKDDAVKVLHSICQKIWKPQQWLVDWKRSVFIPIPKKGSAKKCSDYPTIALISRASKVVLQILQARLQQYVNCELSDVQGRFRRGRGSNCQHLLDNRKSKKVPEKRSLVPLPFVNTTWTSESSQFTYCWSLTWRIWSITLLVCEMSSLLVSKANHSISQ